MQVEMLLSGGGRVPAWPGAAANKLLQCCEDALSVPEWFSSTLKCLLKRCCQFHIFLFKIPFFLCWQLPALAEITLLCSLFLSFEFW